MLLSGLSNLLDNIEIFLNSKQTESLILSNLGSCIDFIVVPFAKTNPIVCACTFGIGQIGRISECIARKKVYLYKQFTIWAHTS